MLDPVERSHPLQDSPRKRSRTSKSMEPPESPTNSWIAIEPPASGPRPPQAQDPYTPPPTNPPPSLYPPTFGEAQFDIVLRRQRTRPIGGGGLKLTAIPSRFLNLSNDFEFSGWGTVSHLDLAPDDLGRGEETLQGIRRSRVLGQFMASALAGNDILGGVFYTLPAVVGVASVYSPISLLVAALTLFLWRPVMEELGSALPISGAPYTYLLNVSSKSLALVGAALLLLDFAATAVVSAATAATYLAGEVSLPFPPFVGAILVLVIFTLISLSGLKESARIAFAVLALHGVTMMVLLTASAVHWGRHGNSRLKDNWIAGQASSAPRIATQIFYGVCIGMLGLTGFECTPAYTASIKQGRYPLVLRNLHLSAMFLNVITMLFVFAVLPLDVIVNGANLLSVLAEVAAGRWLRTWAVVDAVVVLCGGVLTGILSACELLERLAHDRVLPAAFLKSLPLTGSPHVAIISFVVFSGVLYASSGASLAIMSKMFSLVWLTVMMLFPLSALLLKFNRGRLPRTSVTSLSVIFFTIAVALAISVGNIVIDPTTVGYFAIYFIAIIILFSACQNKGLFVRLFYWAYDQSPVMQTWSWTRPWSERLAKLMRRMRRQPVCILCKTDEINHLFQMVLYVRQNEETACLKLVHFYDEDEGLPSEMEANWKILDEAFPEMTVDLILVKSTFSPVNVAALAHRLQIPRSLMFMSCPGPNFLHSVADFGTRIICL
ncbi:hypothetical protein JAAARDRAFT_157891 [Jaapia argillacea MUCL 33604]|uniref:Amino acid permease/ SLC12A domain-containing protein n=1 Tax=Jaapia argillacea MUCL 33604 TaxID=933084 RepID=A0A067PPH7_9AGAM|nr:hypothetical protein JAAARDRAFT_157891 [Jaapia argillacea MUCL 33604]